MRRSGEVGRFVTIFASYAVIHVWQCAISTRPRESLQVMRTLVWVWLRTVCPTFVCLPDA